MVASATSDQVVKITELFASIILRLGGVRFLRHACESICYRFPAIGGMELDRHVMRKTVEDSLGSEITQ